MQTYQMIQEYNNNQLNGENGFYMSNLENFDEYVNDPHSVAGCLKAFFRELSEPLFVFAIYDDLVHCAGISNTNDRLTALWKIVNAMPKPHVENLRYLIKFFAKLASNSEINKMSAQNLAIAIAPSLIWCPPSTSETGNSSPNSIGNPMSYGPLDMCSANQYGIIIETLILYSDWFFPGEIDFDSIRKVGGKRKQSGDQTPSRPATTTNQSQQCSPKSQIKSEPQTPNNQLNKDRNPLPTPRMSTRKKSKAPAPQVPISKALNQSNGIQNINYNATESSNFVTNSPFLANQSSIFQTENLPTLKSFERKGSFQENQQLSTPKPLSKSKHINHSNSSSGTGSTSNSQDSVCGDNQQQQNQVHIQPKQQFISFTNRSNDSLLSSTGTEPNYQNLEQYQLSSRSSSSSENLDQPNSSTPRADSKRTNAIGSQNHNQTPTNRSYNSNNLIGGSLDRRTVRQLNVGGEGSRQIGGQKTSSSFMNPNRSRPQSIPPPPPRPQFKATRSHDDLLLDENDQQHNKKDESTNRSTVKCDPASQPDYANDSNKSFNLKLDVKGINYNDDLLADSSTHLVSYIKLDGSDVKFTNEQVDSEKSNNNSIADQQPKQKPPDKPPRNSDSNSPPPRPPSIFKSSKSLMNEHTYL